MRKSGSMLRVEACNLFLVTLGVLAVNGSLVDDLGDCPPPLPRTQYVKSYNDVCLYLITGKDSWNNANSNCHKHGGHLVHIQDQDKQDFIYSTLTSMHWGDWGVWIGATDHDSEGTWKWTDGTRLSYGNWHPGEGPTHGFLFTKAGYEDCALLRLNDNGRWHDYDCGTILYHHTSICEYQKVYRPTTPTIPTTTIEPPKTPMPTTAVTKTDPPTTAASKTNAPTTAASKTNAPTTTIPTTPTTTMPITTTTSTTMSTTTLPTTTTTTMPTTTMPTTSTTPIKTTETSTATTTFGGIKIEFGTTPHARKRKTGIDIINEAQVNRHADGISGRTGSSVGTYIAIGISSFGVVILVAVILALVLRRRNRQSVPNAFVRRTNTNDNPLYDIMHGNGPVPENSFA